MIEGAVITFFDITEMKRAREALKESETLRRLAVVVNDSRDAILVQDLDGRVLCWNPGATRMYGWTEAEALSMNIRQLTPETGQGAALAVVRQLKPGRGSRPLPNGADCQGRPHRARLADRHRISRRVRDRVCHCHD